MKCYPDFNASRVEFVYYVFKTSAELLVMGYYPVITANSTEVLFRLPPKSFTA
jgi:hypothetical protein